MPEFFQQAMELARDPEVLGYWPAVLRLLIAGGLGVLVAGFHAYSCRTRGVKAQISATLIMLTMLITMVTMAIGNDMAKAFTLVGTLAIVRFRTNVSDIRDTVFVIFAVAVGLSMGANNPTVAISGGAVIGAASVIIALAQGGTAVSRATGRVTLRMQGAGPHDAVIDAILREQTNGYRMLEARVDKDGNARLAYEVDCAGDAGGALIAALDAVPEVLRAAASFDADSASDWD